MGRALTTTMNTTSIQLSVIIPGHNEAENLRRLIPALDDALAHVNYELVVVNNASTDHTDVVLQELARAMPRTVVVHEPALGYGRAVRAGLAASRGAVLAIIRADHQEKPEDLARMHHLLIAEGAHIYKGIRKSRRGDGVARLLVSRVYNALFRAVFHVPYQDINAAPKLMTRAFYDAALLVSNDWFIDAEIMLKAAARSCKVGEVEIEYLPRKSGRSLVRPRHVVEFLRNMVVWKRTYGT